MIYRLFNPDVLDAAVDRQASDLVRDNFSAAKWLIEPNNIALTDGRNIGLFEAQEQPGLFHGHIVFADRGRKALEAARRIICALVTMFGSLTLRGEPPVQRRAARWFTRQLGFRSEGIKSTPYGDVEVFVMECAA